MVGRPGGPLADAAIWEMTVVRVETIAEDYQRVIFGGGGLDRLTYQAGQDLMLRIPSLEERPINRRYTIRSSDPATGTIAIDMVVHGDGPGARWAAEAVPGDLLEAVGPRGKVVVDDEADWHLFIGDETALPGMAAMAESLSPGVPGVVIVEVARHVPGHDPELAADQDVRVLWLERGDAEPGLPDLLVPAAEQVELPSGIGHAYVAGEMKVVRSVGEILASRGLEGSSVALKAYWRQGGANASHGEPLDPDRPMRRPPPAG
jgi:NADPH-dependent ferric siderophore reductase